MGESASRDHKVAQGSPLGLLQLIKEKGYRRKQVFNADETGPFLKMSSRMFMFKKEWYAPVFKAAKDGISFLFLPIALGTVL